MPRYTILIPTRNGIKYLPFAIESVLCQNFNDCEIVVSDNYSIDGTDAYLKTLQDPRLIVTKPPRPLSMAAHYEYMLSVAKGDWITILGDDDALMPYFFDYLEHAEIDKYKIDAIATRRAYFFWPGCEDTYGDNVVYYDGADIIIKKKGRFNLFLTLASILEYTEIPQTYTTGLVHRRLIDKIKSKSKGRFYFASSPDVYSALVLSLECSNYLRFEKPLFWVGTSPKSIGLSGSTKNENNRYKEFWEQCKDDGFEVDKSIPKDIFELRESAIFIYDAVLNSPLSGVFLRSSFLKHLIYAGVMAKENGPDLIPACERLNLQKSIIYTLKFFLKLINFVFKVINKFKNLYRRLTVNKNIIISKNRIDFPDIAHASEAVRNLQDI